MNRAEALGGALCLPVEGPRVLFRRGPEPADILVTRDAYVCRFEAPDLDASDREIRDWADWTAATRVEVAEIWPTIAHLAPPPVEIACVASPVYDPPPLAHAYPIGPLVPEYAEHVHWEATREGDLAVTRASYPGPSIGWHAWGAPQAALAGVSRAWEGLDPSGALSCGHPAAHHVETLLARAAEVGALPRGIVALDLAGLPLKIVLPVTRASREGWRDRRGEGRSRSHHDSQGSLTRSSRFTFPLHNWPCDFLRRALSFSHGHPNPRRSHRYHLARHHPRPRSPILRALGPGARRLR